MNWLRGAWQFLRAPRFAVDIDMKSWNYTNEFVTAGEKTKICTISVSLDYDGQLDRSKYVRPLSNYYQHDKVYVTCENERWVNETLVLDMFVYVTVAGAYSIIPKFPADSYVKFKGTDRGVGLEVKPSNTCYILLKKYVNSNPIADECSEKFVSSYRGDTVNMYVAVVDEFQNKYLEDDLDFRIVSDNQSVKVVQLTTHDRRTGWYVISVCYHKVGTTTIKLSFQEETHLNAYTLNQVVKVLTPPVSAAKSYIIQSDIDEIQDRTHEAGKAITFKLQLNDIIGNPISYEESKVFLEKFIGLVSHRDTVARNEGIARRRNANQENIAPKVRPVDFDPNICEVEFTPSIAGNRRVSLFADRKTEEISTITIRIKAGPLEELQIVKRVPSDFRDVYRGDRAKIWVKAKDEFGNRIVESNLTFAIFSDSSLVKLLSTDCVDDSEQGSHQLTIRWEKVGKGSFDLIASQGNRQVRKDISLEVIPPPVSAAKSYIIQSDIDEIQEKIHEAGRAITFKLKLIDILGNPIPSEESVQYQDQFRHHYIRDIYPNWSCATENGRSLSIRLSKVDSNICELEFTPLEAGKGTYYFKIDDERLSKSIKIAVLPRQGDEQIIQNNNAYIDREKSVNKLRKEIPYNSEMYLEFYKCDQKILCLGVRRRDLVGEDYANINNINRVLEKEYPSCKLSNDLVSLEYGRLLVVFDLSSFEKDAALKVLELLSYLVEGRHHYRNEAKEFGNETEKWKKRATEAYNAKNHKEAKHCKANKETCGDFMHESHRQASDAISNFYNYGRPQSQIDLHGQLVGNTKISNAYKKQLLSKGDKSVAEVDAMIERERKQSDEAIRKLDERIENFDHEKAKRDGEDWLEIIDGAGHHSARRGEQKIRPKVKEYLGKKDRKYVEANEGALLITFSEYTGKEPCVADFYCTRCKKTWTSKNSWKALFQMCSRCHNEGTISNCYPFKLGLYSQKEEYKTLISLKITEDSVRSAFSLVRTAGDNDKKLLTGLQLVFLVKVLGLVLHRVRTTP